MQQQQKVSFETKYLKYEFFVRRNQSLDLTVSTQQQISALQGILRWLNGYENIKELSHIGKNPIVRYNYISDQYNCVATVKSVRLDCEGKNPFCRYYLQQDQVKGKTNLAQIYIHSQLDKLMQMNQNQDQIKQSQKWRGRVQNVFLEFRKFVQAKITQEKQFSVAVRIQLLHQ